MRRLILLALAASLLLPVWGGCATTAEKEKEKQKTAEQLKLEQKYHKLREKRDKIKRQASAILSKAPKLFKKATALEKKRKLAGKKSIAVTPKGQPLPGKTLVLGPLKLDHKKRSFKVKEGSKKGASGMNYYPCTISPK